MRNYMLIYKRDHNGNSPEIITSFIKGDCFHDAVRHAPADRYVKFEGKQNYYRLAEVKEDE